MAYTKDDEIEVKAKKHLHGVSDPDDDTAKQSIVARNRQMAPQSVTRKKMGTTLPVEK